MTEHDLPVPPKRPHGTGSIELRGRGYLARWRAGGRQESQMFGSLEEATAHLDGIFAMISRADIASLVKLWRDSAKVVIASTTGPSTWAQALIACANDLEKVIRG